MVRCMHHAIALSRTNIVARLQLALLALFVLSPASAAEFTLSVADIVAPDFSARGIALVLPADGSADLRIAELRVRQRVMRKTRLHCATFELFRSGVSCRGGSLDALPGVALEFKYLAGVWQVAAQLHNAPAQRFAPFLPADLPLPTQGALNGTLRASGGASGMEDFNADVKLVEVGFSDASGLHAAEKLRGSVRLAAHKGAVWNWQGNIDWQSGDMFWQPLYLRGGQKLAASGSYDGTRITVAQAAADLPGVGRVQFAAQWDMQQSALVDAAAHGNNLALERLFADYAKPFLDKGALAESSLSGHADIDWQYRDGATQSLRLALHDAGIADAEKRFALRGVNSDIDWQADAPRTANIAFAGGALLGAPLGTGQWTVHMRGLEFDVPLASLPILDGKLELRDFSLHRKDNGWRWQFAGFLSPLSMERFSQAAGWPKMLGTMAGRIPRVSYDGNRISVDGALLFNVFDGTIVATKLELADAFGRAPRLSGNLNMRELDLDLLTRTFSFGSMQGRIDVDVNNLQLENWQPVRFDARVFSSAGNYPRKISQKAVQNISSLGGAGAAAAIQRSYLRFFENFGYDRIGWSCVLRNGVCAMGGVDGGNGAAYALIKGGGIPAISVMGYNRNVGWDELITRLKRVTQNNVKPVVK
ncbi:MAG TPA: hypothetical protein VFW53_06465 [Gallionella sp.]|nr:hypothetical protein [Gallionella sp.]